MRGNSVRIVEQRRNHALARTLRQTGSGASRHFYEQFRDIQLVTYEPRSGAHLLEWVTRELALIDVAVAVGDIDDELCRWIANVTRERLTRVYLTWEPEELTAERVEQLELGLFDLILAPSAPSAPVAWLEVPRVVAPADRTAGIADLLKGHATTADQIATAAAFERLVAPRDSRDPMDAPRATQ